MRARASAAVLLAALGSAAAIAVTTARADDPTPPATVTVVQTRTVQARVQGRTAAWWSRRAVQARKDANARARTVRRLRRVQHRRWSPTVDYGLRLASAVYGVPYSKMRAVAWCESRLDPFAVNGRYRGLLQEGPMFERGPFASFGVYDPIANALTGAQVMAREGFGQWECKP